MFESVRSIRPAWIGIGWFLGAALTSLLVFVLSVVGLIRANAPTEGMGVALSLLVGFVMAGFWVGTRVNAAPVLHGVGMGLVSLAVWFALNVFAGSLGEGWHAVSGPVAVALLGLQTASAVVGARAGVRFARRASALA